MTQEHRQLLLKDLCARLPYRVKFALSGDSIYTMKGIDLIVTDGGEWGYAVTAKGIEPIEIEYIKPYLRPMSSMTEEEINEFIVISDTVLWLGEKRSTCILSLEQMDWLNAYHFDYRGLIPMGLALEAPKGMYKIE